MWVPDWDKILEEPIFEVPAEILLVLTPGEIARVDQYLARIKQVGGLALDDGKDPDEVLELIVDDLENMASIVELAMRRSLTPDPPPDMRLLDMNPDFEQGEDETDGKTDDLPDNGMPW